MSFGFSTQYILHFMTDMSGGFNNENNLTVKCLVIL